MFGKVMGLLLFAGICKLWWPVILFSLGFLVIVVLPVMAVSGREQIDRQQRQRDELDQVMQAWDAEDRR